MLCCVVSLRAEVLLIAELTGPGSGTHLSQGRHLIRALSTATISATPSRTASSSSSQSSMKQSQVNPASVADEIPARGVVTPIGRLGDEVVSLLAGHVEEHSFVQSLNVLEQVRIALYSFQYKSSYGEMTLFHDLGGEVQIAEKLHRSKTRP